ncbi:MAG: 7TM-DISM domain-containing protein [Leptospiraceae bacterium]|nr:7TM-DISM domain-containing protein [Leptospiraceae bacterium]
MINQKIKIPSSINSIEKWQKAGYLNYCIQIQLSQEFQNKELGLSLGYIDNFYRIYWNKTLIGSTEERETRIALFYDEPIVLKIPKELTHNVENILEVQVQKNTKSISGSGIAGRILEISPYLLMKRKALVYKYYNFGKVILFISTAILFLILFVSRRKELEYLFFSLFLFVISLYYTTKLELKYELELDMLLIKKMEFLVFSLVIPSFTHFLFKLLKISRRNLLLYFITVFGFIFHGIFWYLKDVHEIENFNYLYHVPFLLFSICLQFIVILHQVIKKNKRAIPVFLVVSLPLLVSLIQISNVRFGFLPFISGLLLGGDAILILVISMAAYVGGQFYFLQKKLDNTVQREETLRKTFQLYVLPKDIEKILNSFNEDMDLLTVAP